jgi:hypothetical protein
MKIMLSVLVFISSFSAFASEIACGAEFRGFNEIGQYVVEQVKLREYYSDAKTIILEGELRSKYFAATFYRDLSEVFGQIIQSDDSSIGSTGRSFVPAGRRFKLVTVNGSIVHTLECFVR